MSTTKKHTKKSGCPSTAFSWMPPVTALCRRRFCQVQKARHRAHPGLSFRDLRRGYPIGVPTGCKLLDRCLEAIALRNDLTLGELSLLLSLSQMHTFCSRTELADFAGLSKSLLSRTLQKSFQPKIISASTAPENTCTWICFRQRLRSSRSLATAQNDFDVARFAGFSDEELHLLCDSDGKDQGKYHAGARRLAPGRVF